MSRAKSEIIRRLRLGNLRSLLRARYGHTLPDDDAGREDLFELLLPISLGPEHQRKMANAIEVWANWMGADEISALIDRINRMPLYERKVNARQLGERLRVSNREHESLKLRTIAPFDMTDKQLKEHRKAKDRARKNRQRRLAGCRARQEYLAQSLTGLRPWNAEGISRATWFRRKKLNGETSLSAKQESHETGPSAIKLTISSGQTSLTEKPERPEGLARTDRGESRKTDRGESRKKGKTARGLAS
jgi:hypothetical protein